MLNECLHQQRFLRHYDDVIMGTIASQITSLTSVYSTVYSGADQSKHQSSASLAFVWGIHRGPVNSPHKWPVTRKMFPFDDVIMQTLITVISLHVVHSFGNGEIISSHTDYNGCNHLSMLRLKLHMLVKGVPSVKWAPLWQSSNLHSIKTQYIFNNW